MPHPETPEEPTRTISREDVLRRLGTHRFTLVNVLSRWAYQRRHIAGSLNLPLEELGSHAPEALPDRSGAVAVYCASAG